MTPREIRRLRGSLGMTHAVLLNTHYTTVSRWEAEPQVIVPDAWRTDIMLTIRIGAVKQPNAADAAVAFLAEGRVGCALGVLLEAAAREVQ